MVYNEPLRKEEMEMVYEEVDKFSDDVEVGDDFKIGDVMVTVRQIKLNNHDEFVFHLEIVGAATKKRSKMMLIIPRKTPVQILK